MIYYVFNVYDMNWNLVNHYFNGSKCGFLKEGDYKINSKDYTQPVYIKYMGEHKVSNLKTLVVGYEV